MNVLKGNYCTVLCESKMILENKVVQKFKLSKSVLTKNVLIKYYSYLLNKINQKDSDDSWYTIKLKTGDGFAMYRHSLIFKVLIFANFWFPAGYNFILFSSPLILLSNLDLRGFWISIFCVCVPTLTA